LPVDLAVASAWGKLRGRAEAARRTMSLIDALLAATAEVHDLTLVTRNVEDFEAWGGPVFNPWLAQDS
jgi:predicted nucleic acid-binding protein